MTEDRTLFETEVGSYMWNMQTLQSDRDIIRVYAQPARDILSGKNHNRNKPATKFTKDGMDWEYQHMEIGHLINLLIKGNVNALWAVTSPIVLRPSKELDELRKITLENLSKESFASINGMAKSNFLDNKKRPAMPSNKAYKQCLRVLTFGINLFEFGKVIYQPILKEVTENDIELAFNHLYEARTNTKLITSPNEQVFREYLYTLRVSEFGRG